MDLSEIVLQSPDPVAAQIMSVPEPRTMMSVKIVSDTINHDLTNCEPSWGMSCLSLGDLHF